jgi:hypothetical protein
MSLSKEIEDRHEEQLDCAYRLGMSEGFKQAAAMVMASAVSAFSSGNADDLAQKLRGIALNIALKGAATHPGSKSSEQGS